MAFVMQIDAEKMLYLKLFFLSNSVLVIFVTVYPAPYIFVNV